MRRLKKNRRECVAPVGPNHAETDQGFDVITTTKGLFRMANLLVARRETTGKAFVHLLLKTCQFDDRIRERTENIRAFYLTLNAINIERDDDRADTLEAVSEMIEAMSEKDMRWILQDVLDAVALG